LNLEPGYHDLWLNPRDPGLKVSENIENIVSAVFTPVQAKHLNPNPVAGSIVGKPETVDKRRWRKSGLTSQIATSDPA
jgi:hypothetical protein